MSDNNVHYWDKRTFFNSDVDHWSHVCKYVDSSYIISTMVEWQAVLESFFIVETLPIWTQVVELG